MSNTPAKQINFTIVPDEPGSKNDAPRTYANFCAVAHSPFDLTITFCDVRPLTATDIREAEQTETVRAPIVARIALPFGVVPGLINALQEQLHAMQAAQSPEGNQPWPPGPTH
jgi:hypothetical protein